LKDAPERGFIPLQLGVEQNYGYFHELFIANGEAA
jgi:hypothetical protein